MSTIRNTRHIEIIPGILEQNWEEIEKKIELVLPFTESIHIDVLDGKFAPNTTWMDPLPFAKYTKEIRFEAHLMVDNPMQYLKSFADAGFQRFIGHIEMMSDIQGFVAEAELYGEVGLAIDTPTDVTSLFPYLEDIDIVFVMTHKAGESRLSFDPVTLEKVGELRKKNELLTIEVDGGVTDEDITALKDAGADRFVTTGFLFGGNAEERYRELKKLTGALPYS